MVWSEKIQGYTEGTPLGLYKALKAGDITKKKALSLFINRVANITFPGGEQLYNHLICKHGKQTWWSLPNLWRQVFHTAMGFGVGLIPFLGIKFFSLFGLGLSPWLMPIMSLANGIRHEYTSDLKGRSLKNLTIKNILDATFHGVGGFLLMMYLGY